MSDVLRSRFRPRTGQWAQLPASGLIHPHCPGVRAKADVLQKRADSRFGHILGALLPLDRCSAQALPLNGRFPERSGLIPTPRTVSRSSGSSSRPSGVTQASNKPLASSAASIGARSSSGTSEAKSHNAQRGAPAAWRAEPRPRVCGGGGNLCRPLCNPSNLRLQDREFLACRLKPGLNRGASGFEQLERGGALRPFDGAADRVFALRRVAPFAEGVLEFLRVCRVQFGQGRSPRFPGSEQSGDGVLEAFAGLFFGFNTFVELTFRLGK